MSEEKVLKVNGKLLKVKFPDEEENFQAIENKLSKSKRGENINVKAGRNNGKLTMSTASVILEGIRNGLPIKRTCALAGITPPTLSDWLRKGQKQISEKYIWFYNACLKAEVDCEHGSLKVIQDAIEGGLSTIKEKRTYNKKGRLQRKEINKTINPPSWTAAMTLLERRWPERWGRYDRLRIGEDPENPMINKQTLLEFLINYVGKDNSPIDVEGKVVEQENIKQIEQKQDTFLKENR